MNVVITLPKNFKNIMKYHIHSESLSNYISKNINSNVPCLDSEYNIFFSLSDCAKYHEVSSSTLNNGWFKSKTLDKLVAVSFISPDIIQKEEYDKLFDGEHDVELEKKLAIYDELFEKYLLKKKRASICANGWKGMNKISPMWKTSNGIWTPSDPKKCPMNWSKGVDFDKYFK